MEYEPLKFSGTTDDFRKTVDRVIWKSQKASKELVRLA